MPYLPQTSEFEYLRVEEASKEKHEYVSGRLFAMAGATMAHNIIVSNLHGNLFASVRQSGCTSFVADMKVKVEALGNFYYPDLMISCEKGNPKSVFLTAPCLLIEVTSPSTVEIDCREKLLSYKTIPSVQEYVLVYQTKKRVEVNRKDSCGDWQCHVHEGIDVVELTSIGRQTTKLSIDAIYAGIDFD